MDDDDLERPTMPIWIWLIVALLSIIGAFTVLGWALGALFGVIRLVVAGAFILLVIVAARSFTRRK